ncbi:MAG: FAD:protein FMN transferase [Saprospiraceae bacterium]|nr:FAD:protein FMN transferase [Saprospiraceae bacterium]
MRIVYVCIWLMAIGAGCQAGEKNDGALYQTTTGETMGTYYRITFQATESASPGQRDIDSLFDQINLAVSTYVPESVVSRFNHAALGISVADIDDVYIIDVFFDNVSISFDLFRRTDGFFDPTVMPLVNFWGFGYEPRTVRSPEERQAIDSIMTWVGLTKVEWISSEPQRLQKSLPQVELDFSASAKGYAIDEVGQFLEDSYGIEHYLIDVGGEAKAKGINADGEVWRIGIEDPDALDIGQAYSFILSLDNKSVATSGNYRNYYQSDGNTISHTMNPKTGYFERNDLLSTSIVADSCAIADGFATACMAMGFADALKMITLEPALEALFIYIDEGGSIQHFITPGLRPYVTTRKR